MTSVQAPGRLSRPARARRFNSAYLFIAPSVILIAVFIAEPILQSGWMSLHDWTVGEATHRFVGFGNYIALWNDFRFWNALRVTVVYTVVVAVVQVVVGLALAARLRRTSWFATLLRTAYFFPFSASLVVVGIIWKFLLDPQVGLIDASFSAVGVSSPDWLT
ncbi:MAG: carbohydrate ABC transporter permease, partial [Nakamurella sp.]